MAGQQERKASRAAMAGRQNGRRKWNEVELEGVHSGHKFCTRFSALESAERLVRVFESLVNHSMLICICLCFCPLDLDCLKIEIRS